LRSGIAHHGAFITRHLRQCSAVLTLGGVGVIDQQPRDMRVIWAEPCAAVAPSVVPLGIGAPASGLADTKAQAVFVSFFSHRLNPLSWRPTLGAVGC
jgi:hypothetical protein